MEDSTESEELVCLTAKEENYFWIKQQDDKRKCSWYLGIGQPKCVSLEEDYILWKKRSGRTVGGGEQDIAEEESSAWEARMEVEEAQWTLLKTTTLLTL